MNDRAESLRRGRESGQELTTIRSVPSVRK